jgi:hypothetical protein
MESKYNIYLFLFLSLIFSCNNKNISEFYTIEGNNKDLDLKLFLEYYTDSTVFNYTKKFKGKITTERFSYIKKNNEYWSRWSDILNPNRPEKEIVFMSNKSDTSFHIDTTSPNNYVITFLKIDDNLYVSDYYITGISNFRSTIYHDSNYQIFRYELKFGNSIRIFDINANRKEITNKNWQRKVKKGKMFNGVICSD